MFLLLTFLSSLQLFGPEPYRDNEYTKTEIFRLEAPLNATKLPSDSAKGDFVIINEIKMLGNTKTKDRIIFRELDIKPGDTLYASREAALLQKNKNKIVNTNLFVTVEFSLLKLDNGRADLFIHLEERWYIFPVPIFELADRNFNEWWYERGRDLRRTQYGLRLNHKNFRGRNEQLYAVAQFGFTKRFDLSFDAPYIDAAQRYGLNFDISYSDNKNVAYKTEAHKLVYLQDEKALRRRFYTSVDLTRRDGFYNFHSLGLRFQYNTIADTIALLNPNYFLNKHTTQRYFQVAYGFVRDLRDVTAYPLHGSRLAFGISKVGLLPSDDINQAEVVASYSRYTPLGKKFYFNTGLRGKFSLPNRQPYLNTRGLGYGQDFLRGYELYVIDGQSYALSKSTLKRELFKTQKRLDRFMPLKQFRTVPVAMYVNAYFDMGYVTDNTFNPENNRLANTFLYGGGLGLDLVTFYNVVFRIDYSINRSLERGLFIHFVKDI